MLAVLVWSLTNCLLGYFAFRILLVVNATVAGLILGEVLADALRSEATTLDYLVACGGLAAIAAIGGSLFPRPAFAAIGGLAVGAGVLLLLGDGQPGFGSWMLAAIAGLAAVMLCYRYVRRMVVYLAGAIGSICTVFSAAWLLGWTHSPGIALTVLLVFLATGLSVVGMYCQVFLARRLTHTMIPRTARKHRTARSTTQVHPRFTKI